DDVAGRDFRALHVREHPEMFVRGFACAQGLDWNHHGPAPWAGQFDAFVRNQMQSNAITAAARAPTFGPGGVVKLVLARLGYKPHPKCGCDEFREEMNRWGWWGCVRRRTEIVGWFVAKAREQGIAVDDHTMAALVRGGMRDLLRRRRQIRQ